MLRRPSLYPLALALLLSAAGAQVVVKPSVWRSTAKVPSGQRLSTEFRVTNQGSKPVTILSATGSEGINLQLPKARLGAGESMTIGASLQRERKQQDEEVKASIVLLLDSDQDRVKIPVEASFRGQAPPTKPDSPVAGPKYTPRPNDQPVTGHFFYDSMCGKCEAFIESTIKPVKAHFAGSKFKLEMHDSRGPGEIEHLTEAKERYGVTEEASTYFFVGRHGFVGNEQIEQNIIPTVIRELQQPTEAPATPVAGGEMLGPVGPDDSALRRAFAKLTAPAILLAGGADGINPCAIALAIFLVALLAQLGHDRKIILMAGLCYALAVFLTYLMIGLTLSSLLARLGDRHLLTSVVNTVIGVITLVVAGYQVLDVIRLKRGGATRELSVQMPQRLKQLSHVYLRRHLARPMVMLGAFVAGALVTLLEAVCTGQTYVPILVAMTNSPEAASRSFGLLLIYNFGFVLPLLLIVLLTYGGVTSAAMAAAARRYLGPAKLSLAVLLAVLGGYLLATAWG